MNNKIRITCSKTRKNKTHSDEWVLLVHLTGIEPAHLSILDPKSSASASSATGATARI